MVLVLCQTLALGHDDERGGYGFLKAQKKMPRAKICALSKSMGFLNYTTLPIRNFDYYHLPAGQRAETFRFRSVFETPRKQTSLAFSCSPSDRKIIDKLPRRSGKEWCEMDTYGVASSVVRDAPRDKVGLDLGKSCWTSQLSRSVTK